MWPFRRLDLSYIVMRQCCASAHTFPNTFWAVIVIERVKHLVGKHGSEELSFGSKEWCVCECLNGMICYRYVPSAVGQ